MSFSLHPPPSPVPKKKGRRKISRSWRPNGFRNDSVRKHVVQECHRHIRCKSRSAILLKVCLVNFILFQMCNEGIHNIVTVLFVVVSLRKKSGSIFGSTQHSNPNTRLLKMQQQLVERVGIVYTPDTLVLSVHGTLTNGSMPCL